MMMETQMESSVLLEGFKKCCGFNIMVSGHEQIPESFSPVVAGALQRRGQDEPPQAAGRGLPHVQRSGSRWATPKDLVAPSRWPHGHDGCLTLTPPPPPPLPGIYSTGEVPPGTVLGLNVEDPRLALPQKRTPALSNAVVTLDQGTGPVWPPVRRRWWWTRCCSF